MSISLTLHIVGIIMWTGGLLILTRVMNLFVDSFSSREAVSVLVERLWKRFVLLGMAIAVVTGLFQIYLGGMGYYFKQGWFHAKLTLLIALIAITFMAGREVANAVSGALLNRKKLLLLHAGSGTLLILIILATRVFR